MKLTDAQIRGIKALEKDKPFPDGGGLFLFVTKNGTKSWKYGYTYMGKASNKVTLGQYPEMSLAEARDKHRELKKLKAQGIDPKVAIKQSKFAQQGNSTSSSRTFKKVAEEWLGEYEVKASKSTLEGKRRFLSILNNAVGEVPITEIGRTKILEIAKVLEKDGKSESASRVVMVANQVLNYALDAGYIDKNVTNRLGAKINKQEVQHHPAIIDPKELGEFLTKIDNYSGSPSVMYCLRIISCLALRSTEIRNAKWKELDLENGVWTIPAYRGERPQDGKGMKMRKPHVVPLPTQVIKLFKELQLYTGDNDFCFPSPTDKSKCITEQSVSRAIERMGYKGTMTFHGFRTTFKTLTTEHKHEWDIDRDAIEKQLAHTIGGQVERAYDQSTMLEERKILMQKWADYLDNLKATYKQSSQSFKLE